MPDDRALLRTPNSIDPYSPPQIAARIEASGVVEAVPSDMMVLDIGPARAAHIAALLEDARTLVWNGPLGASERPPFDCGTVAMAKKVAEPTEAGRLLSVAGGGDTVAALVVTDKLSYGSTAAGAFLE